MSICSLLLNCVTESLNACTWEFNTVTDIVSNAKKTQNKSFGSNSICQRTIINRISLYRPQQPGVYLKLLNIVNDWSPAAHRPVTVTASSATSC